MIVDGLVTVCQKKLEINRFFFYDFRDKSGRPWVVDLGNHQKDLHNLFFRP
jgi:hypothetical protein